MAISREEIKEIRKEILESENPIVFFDNDPDGLTSYLLFKKAVPSARGVVVNGFLTETQWTDKLEREGHDKVFILDKPVVEEGFFRRISVKKIWIDHHPIEDIILPRGVKYFNPRLHKKEDGRPVSYWIYEILKKEISKYVWLSAIGSLADYYLIKSIVNKTFKQYPFMFEKLPKNVEEALYKDKIFSRIVKIFSFSLVGKKNEVKRNVKILEQVEGPDEIVYNKGEKIKIVMDHYKKYHGDYYKWLSIGKRYAKEKDVIEIFIDNKYFPIGILSTELSSLYPNKLIVIARKKDSAINVSIREQKNDIREIVQKAVQGIGTGGGHEHACGAAIKPGTWDVFLKRLEEAYKALKKH